MPTINRSIRYRLAWSGSNVRKNGAVFPLSGSKNDLRLNTRTTGPNFSNWKQRIKSGRNATTELSGRLFRLRSVPFVATHYLTPKPGVTVPSNAFTSGSYSGDLPVNMPVSPIKTGFDGLDSTAKSKFVSKCNKKLRSFQGGVFLGELRETLRTIRHPAQSIRRGLSSYLTSVEKQKRRIRRLPQRTRVAEANKVVSGTWLEYAFGWAPLLNDIDDGIETLAKHIYGDDNPRDVMVVGEASSEHYSSQGQGQFGSNGYVYTMYQDITAACAIKYFGKVAVSHPSKITLRRIGLSFSDIIPTAWELIPWSFAIDYFTNIGDILEGASFLRSQLRWVSRTERFQTTETTYAKATPSSSTNWVLTGHITGGKVVASVTDVSRAPFLGSLVPDFQFHLPGFSRQWINLGALVHQAQRSRLL